MAERNIKEELSAWLDNEATEIEIHRVLRTVEEDPEARRAIVGMQAVGGVARGDRLLPLASQVALADRIRAAVELEPAHGHEKGHERGHEGASVPQRYWPQSAMGLTGLAASLALAVAVVFGVMWGADEQPQIAEAAPAVAPAVPVVPVATDAVLPAVQSAAGLVAQDAGVPPINAAVADQGELRDLSPARLQHLRDQLLEHERRSRLNPNVRTVRYRGQLP